MRSAIVGLSTLFLFGCQPNTIYVNRYVVLDPPEALLETYPMQEPLNYEYYRNVSPVESDGQMVEKYVDALRLSKELWVERNRIALEHNQNVQSLKAWVVDQKQSYGTVGNE